MRKKIVFCGISFTLVVFTLAYFINISNDHIECGSETFQEKTSNGQVKVTTTHICKEQYSF